MFRKSIAVFFGFVAAFMVMISFEFGNSYFFPFPQGFDTYNPGQVRLFIEQHSPNIFLLVIVGWIVGSIAGGVTTTAIARDSQRTLCIITGSIATALQVLNFLFLPHPFWAMAVGVVVMIPCYLIGNLLAGATMTYKMG